MTKTHKAAAVKSTPFAASAQVAVKVKMDPLTRTSTTSIRRNMKEAVKEDLRILKKFGLFTP